MISGINQVINNLRKVRNAINNDINSLFITKSLEWIRDRAIEILKTKLSFQPNWFGTEVTTSVTQKENGDITGTWVIKQISKNSYILENTYENSASIEFGIGIVAEENPHVVAEEVGYNYNVPSIDKDISGAWTFKDQNEQIWYRFRGYEGKSFLYDAFMEYKQNNIWVKKYQEAFDEIMRSVIK